MKNKARENLRNLADEKFKIFSQRLIFQPEILGVKTPEVKKLAKILALSAQEIAAYEPFYHEEFLLKGFLILSLKQEELKFKLAAEFVKTMPNWAVCDQFCALKFKDEIFAVRLLNQCLCSSLEYEKRFFYVYFMKMLAGFSIDEFFKICENEKDERYYVKTAAAWAIAEIYLKFPAKTIEFLKGAKLDIRTKNKASQKICDSRRVSEREKAELKTLKIKTKGKDENFAKKDAKCMKP